MTQGLEILVSNKLPNTPIDESQLIRGVQEVLAAAGIRRGEISIAIIDDATMQQLNNQYLQHDYPTDVLSFCLDHEDDWLEGEIIVSAQYATREAERFGWSMLDELTLYVIHGALHLVGYDDLTPEEKQAMRAQEIRHLQALGMEPKYDCESKNDCES